MVTIRKAIVLRSDKYMCAPLLNRGNLAAFLEDQLNLFFYLEVKNTISSNLILIINHHVWKSNRQNS